MSPSSKWSMGTVKLVYSACMVHGGTSALPRRWEVHVWAMAGGRWTALFHLVVEPGTRLEAVYQLRTIILENSDRSKAVNKSSV